MKMESYIVCRNIVYTRVEKGVSCFPTVKNGQQKSSSKMLRQGEVCAEASRTDVVVQLAYSWGNGLVLLENEITTSKRTDRPDATLTPSRGTCTRVIKQLN